MQVTSSVSRCGICDLSLAKALDSAPCLVLPGLPPICIMYFLWQRKQNGIGFACKAGFGGWPFVIEPPENYSTYRYIHVLQIELLYVM